MSTLRDQPSELALERRFPALAGRLSRCGLTALPTPVGRLERLGREARIANLYIKRDDLSGPLYGGNKPRKLEFVLGDARRRGRKTVLTFGAIGSHQALATTVCAKAVGLRVQLVLVPQPVTEHVLRTLLLDHALGAELHLARGVAHAAATALALIVRGTITGAPPALIPAGATSTLGTIGYVNAGLELAEQVRAGALPAPDTIFVPLGTGGTVAGLALGLRLAGLESRVVGVLVTDILTPSSRRLARLAQGALAYLRRRAPEIPRVDVKARDFTIVTSELGPGYGVPTPAAEEAQRLMAQCEGIALETTYTAKCLAAVLDLARESPGRHSPALELPWRDSLTREQPWRDGTVLFWNTFSAIEPEPATGLPAPSELPPAFSRFFSAPESEAHGQPQSSCPP